MDILIKALLIVLPLGNVIRFEVVPNAFLYPLDIVIAVMVGWLLIKQNIVRFLFHSNVGRAMMLFAFFGVIGLLLNSIYLDQRSFLVSFLYLVRFAVYFLIIFAVGFHTTKSQNYILWLSLSGFVTVIAGYIQYFFYPNLRNLFYLGWDEHLYRMFSTFLDPNFAGVFFVLVSILLITLFQEEKNKYMKISFFCMTAMTVGALLLTYSRSAFIMFAITLGIYFFISRQKKVLTGLLILFMLGIILLPKGGGGEGVNLFRTFSINQRLESVQHGISLFQKSPIYGVGFNAYRYAQLRHGYLKESKIVSNAGAGVSNSYVFLLATTGVVGLLLYLNIWREIVRVLLPKRKNVSLYKYAAIVASLGGVFVHAFFENTLFYTSIIVWIYLLIGSLMDDRSLE